MRGVVALAILFSAAVAAQALLTDADIDEAIAAGKRGMPPVVHVGQSRDFDVSIAGPQARIALAAVRAAKRLTAFERADVNADLRVAKYLVIVLSNAGGRYLAPTHIALQTKGAAPTIVQPSAEDGDVDSTLPGRQATFDRLPEGDFDVIVATTDAPQRFSVGPAERAKIR